MDLDDGGEGSAGDADHGPSPRASRWGSLERRGSSPRKFRTTYALAAPDYNHFGTLGLGEEEYYHFSKDCQKSTSVTEANVPGSPSIRRVLSRSQSWSHIGGRATDHAASKQIARVSRWWLHEVTHDKSGGEGLYEIFTGLVGAHTTPDRTTPRVAVVRAGTRFRAKPFDIKGCTWLRIVKVGTPAPLLSSAASTIRAVAETGVADPTSPGGRGKRDSLLLFYAQSGVEPLSPGSDALHTEACSDILCEVSDFWIEDNKQYVRRIRDLDKEKGRRTYSVLSRPAMRPLDPSNPVDRRHGS